MPPAWKKSAGRATYEQKGGAKKHPLFYLDRYRPSCGIDEDDPYFKQASESLRRLPKVPLLMTWPCFTEAMYLLSQAGGYHAQEKLWGWVADGLVQIHSSTEAEWRRMRELMGVFRDSPMDLADASVVAAAESLSADQVFTFDKHFYAYRLGDGSALEVVG